MGTARSEAAQKCAYARRAGLHIAKSACCGALAEPDSALATVAPARHLRTVWAMSLTQDERDRIREMFRVDRTLPIVSMDAREMAARADVTPEQLLAYCAEVRLAD